MAGKRHEKRFIIEVVRQDKTRFRSNLFPASYATREEAQAAIDAYDSQLVNYKVRQK